MRRHFAELFAQRCFVAKGQIIIILINGFGLLLGARANCLSALLRTVGEYMFGNDYTNINDVQSTATEHPGPCYNPMIGWSSGYRKIRVTLNVDKYELFVKINLTGS